MRKLISTTLALIMLINIFCIKISANTTPLLILDRAGGIGGTETVIVAQDGQIQEQIITPTRNSYGVVMTFAGYFAEPGGLGLRYYNPDGVRVFHEQWEATENVRVYAHWLNEPYMTVFHNNGTYDFEFITLEQISNGHSVPESVNLTPPSIMPTPFHDFVGYEDLEGNLKSQPLFFAPNEPLSINARYRIVRYLLTFEDDGGTGVGSIIITGNVIAQGQTSIRVGHLPEAITPPTQNGFTFNGYFSEENGNGDLIYTPYGARVNNPQFQVFGTNMNPSQEVYTHTVYASWTPNSYNVVLDKSDGIGGTDDFSVFFSQMPDNLTPPTRTGHDFDGYYSEANGKGIMFFDSDGEAIRIWDIASDKVLHAHWITQSYTVTFNSNGGSPVNSITAVFGGTITAPSAPIRENHGFGGWYLENTRIQFPYTVSGDVTLTAQWVEDGKCVDCEEYEIDCICKHCDICDELTHPKDECSCKYCEVCDKLEHPKNECVCAYCTVCDELIHPKDECICEYCNICDELKGDCICKYCEGCDKLEHPENNCVCCEACGSHPCICCLICKLAVCICCKDCENHPCDCPPPPTCIICYKLEDDCDCPTFQITFNSNGGNSESPIIINKHGIITNLPNPTRSGFDLIGWFIETDSPDFVLGRILPGDNRNPTIGDVLELLKFLAGIQGNVIAQGGQGSRSWNASLITPASITANRPGINDALEILKRLAGIDGILSNLPPLPEPQPITLGMKITENLKAIALWTPTPPATPTGVTVASDVRGGITVTWNAVENADGYEVLRAESANGAFGRTGTIAASSFPSHNENGLTPGKTYYYIVRAFRLVDGERIFSENSAPVSRTVSN